MYATFVRRLDAECDVDVCRSLLSFGKERKISASLPLPSLSTFNNRTSSFTEILWPLVYFSRNSEDMSASCTSCVCTRVSSNKHICLKPIFDRPGRSCVARHHSASPVWERLPSFLCPDFEAPTSSKEPAVTPRTLCYPLARRSICNVSSNLPVRLQRLKS